MYHINHRLVIIIVIIIFNCFSAPYMPYIIDFETAPVIF